MDHDLVFIRNNRGLPSVKSLPPGLCNYPSRVVNIDSQGRVFVCLCEAWAPWSIGHVLDFQSIEEIWQHPQTRSIASSQDRGEYSYCDTLHCNVGNQHRHLHNIQLYIGLDDSCQLSCPSCRNESIFEKDYDVKLPWIDHISNWLSNQPNLGPVDVLIGSRGDPFASGLYRRLIANLAKLTKSPPVRFQLKTNGLLLTRYLHELDIIDQLSMLEISIDAATADTYHQVRRPARWTTLIENLDYCLELRGNHAFQVKANFVVQKSNYKEMLGFVELCRKYIMFPSFTVLQDWNTFSYADNAVHLTEHPEHEQFLEIVSDSRISPFIGKRFDNWTKS